MAGRLGNNEQAHRTGRRIANLMVLSGQDSDAASRTNQRGLALDFHENLTAENEKELLRLLVMVANFGGARRHDFLDHVQLRIFHQVPSIAVVAPSIMLSIFPTHRTWGRSLCKIATG